jgi:hypothetical protein
MINGLVLTSLIGIIVLFIIFNQYKKRIFNSIKVGDEIFHQQATTFCDEYCEEFESDVVVKVEYYENCEDVKCIHTENGKKFTFLDFMRDEFVLRYD